MHLSGGPDSVCLLHILYELKDKFNLNLGATHINHMLRGEEAVKDEKYVISYVRIRNKVLCKKNRYK